MAIKNPRIIIAEEDNGIAQLVRASLEMLGRRPRIIETQTSDDAWDEIHLRTPDLLITAQALPGKLNGPALALEAKKQIAALPVIVLGQPTDPEPTDEDLSTMPFQYLRRPLVPEIFIRELRAALDGPEAAMAEETPVDMLGPVPQIDSDKLKNHCRKLMVDVGAMSYILADRNGKVLAYDGMAGYVDRDLMAAAIGPSIGATARLLSILGDHPRTLKYYDGDKFDVFCLAIGIHYFLSLVFDGQSGNRALGNVARFGRTTVDEILGIIGESAFKAHMTGVMPAVSAPAPQPTTSASKTADTTAPVMDAPTPAALPTRSGRNRRTQEISALNSEQLPDSAPLELPTLTPLTDFDPSILDALDSLDLSAAEDLFAPEQIANVANALSAGNRLSRADAEAQGIISFQEGG
jgi:DNA-binding response OmpR family regulator